MDLWGKGASEAAKEKAEKKIEIEQESDGEGTKFGYP